MQELFRKVQPQQCLGSVWSRRTSGSGRQNGGRGAAGGGQSTGTCSGAGSAGCCDETVASVSATVDQFNAVTHRLIASVVGDMTSSAPASAAVSTSQRARVVEKWIDIAQVRAPPTRTQWVRPTLAKSEG